MVVPKVFQRLLILCFLCGCLFVLSTPLHVRVFAEACATCDANRNSCYMTCTSNYNDCSSNGTYDPNGYCAALRSGCNNDCDSSYGNCLAFCTFQDPPSGGGGSGTSCGQGRTSCELSCRNERLDCFQTGGTTCGEDYTACMNGCCP